MEGTTQEYESETTDYLVLFKEAFLIYYTYLKYESCKLGEASIATFKRLDAFITDSVNMISPSIEKSRVPIGTPASGKIPSNRNGSNRGRSRKLRGWYKSGRIHQNYAKCLWNLLPLASFQLLSYCVDVLHEACKENKISFVHELCVAGSENRFKRVYDGRRTYATFYIYP